MTSTSLEDQILRLRRRDHRYRRFAYEFVLEALDHTIVRLQRGAVSPGGLGAPDRHVRGQELLEGVRELALQRFGRLARIVLNHWGVRRTEDVGEIVFLLIDVGLLNRHPSDSRLDFADGYDFELAFERDAALS